MPMRMTFKGRWPIRRRQDPVPVVIKPANPKDVLIQEQARKLSALALAVRTSLDHTTAAEVFRLQDYYFTLATEKP